MEGDILIYGPFSSVLGISDCAIALRAEINCERRHYEFCMKQYEDFGGEHATGDNFYTARAFINQAECHNYTLRILERLSRDFAETLTPAALKDIRDTFKLLDERESKKAV